MKMGLFHFSPPVTVGEELSCHEVRNLQNLSDQCLFVQTNADCLQLRLSGGHFDYLVLFYCPLHHVVSASWPYLSVFLCLSLLCLLFVALGVSADQFFCPNLATISKTLR